MVRSMTTIDQFLNKECDKIDPSCIDAYLDLSLDPLDPSKLVLDSSWGTDYLDLTPAVKDAETVTHLSLYPDNNPTDLMFCNEDGEAEHITGDALSRIISMTKLKDVSQTTNITNGDVYMYSSTTGKFEPFDLSGALGTINQNITNLGNRIDNLQGQINQLSTRIDNLQGQINTINSTLNTLQGEIDDINAVIAKPSGIPNDARIVWGNINLISDPSDTNNKSKGLFTHNTANDLYADEYFA